MSEQSFRYQAFDAGGKRHSGALEAESQREAARILQGRRLTPIRIEPGKASGLFFGMDFERRKISATGLLDFTNGLCTLVEARVPIDRALRLLEGIAESAAMRELVRRLLREVKEGSSLAEAMEQHPEVFSKMYVNIVRAGEEGGILHELLPDLAGFLERNAATRQSIVSAMVYPVVLVVTGILSVGLLLVFVIPQFAAMFQGAGAEIPASAAFLLAMSGWLQSYGYLLMIVAALGFIGWKRLDASAEGRYRKDRFLLSLPLLGHLLLYRECALFARTMGALMGAGIPLIRALRVAREVLVNTVLTQELARVEEDVRGGAGLGVSLEKTNRFPTLLHQLVGVGEESGRTAGILLKAADTFDSQVRHQVATLVSALQPALIIILAIVVGGITITMLSAVFSMNTVEF